MRQFLNFILKIGLIFFIIATIIGVAGYIILDDFFTISEDERQFVMTGEEFRSTLSYSRMQQKFLYTSLGSCIYEWGEPDRLRKGGMVQYNSAAQAFPIDLLIASWDEMRVDGQPVELSFSVESPYKAEDFLYGNVTKKMWSKTNLESFDQITSYNQQVSKSYLPKPSGQKEKRDIDNFESDVISKVEIVENQFYTSLSQPMNGKMRAKPNLNSELVSEVTPNDEILVYGKVVSSNWYKIKVNNKTGYILKGWLEPKEYSNSVVDVNYDAENNKEQIIQFPQDMNPSVKFKNIKNSHNLNSIINYFRGKVFIGPGVQNRIVLDNNGYMYVDGTPTQMIEVTLKDNKITKLKVQNIHTKDVIDFVVDTNKGCLNDGSSSFCL